MMLYLVGLSLFCIFKPGFVFALPIVFIHRGTHDNFPENSLKSFENVFHHLHCSVEFDIRESADDHYVVIHDETLNRTTTSTGFVRDFELSDLKTVALKGKEDSHLFSLLDLFELAHRYKVASLLLEVKAVEPDHLGNLVSFVEKHWHKDIVYYAKMEPTYSQLAELAPSNNIMSPQCLKKFPTYDQCFQSINPDGRPLVIKITWAEFEIEYAEKAKGRNIKTLITFVGVNTTEVFSQREADEKNLSLKAAIERNLIDYFCTDGPFSFHHLFHS